MHQLIKLAFALPFVVVDYYLLRKLTARQSLRALLAGFLTLAVIGYPIADALSHRSVSGWAKPLIILGLYCLPFVLYLAPLVIIVELIVTLLRRSKLVSADTLNHWGCRVARICCVVILPVIIVSIGAVNNTLLVVRGFSVEIPRRSSILRQLRIAFASDFHLGQFTADDLVKRFADKVNAQNSDIVMIGGDVQDSVERAANLDRFCKQFRSLRSKYGVYAVTGNHDIRAGINAGFFERSGIKLLRDSVERIDDAFYLVGRDDQLSGTRKPLTELLRNIPDDLPVLVLDHNPAELERTSRFRVDLQLSGHTHDGQFFPLNLIPSEEFELSWGYLKKRQTHFLVSSGVELTRPPVRTAGLSEILVVDVLFRPSPEEVPGLPSSVFQPAMPVH